MRNRLATSFWSQHTRTQQTSTATTREDDDPEMWGSLLSTTGLSVEFRSPKLKYTIGREPGAHEVDFSFPSISRMSRVQCTFEAIGLGKPGFVVRVTDLGSTNGTWVNNTHIGHRGSTLITHNGATISFGPWSQRPDLDDRIQLRLYRHDDQSVIDPAMPFVEDFYRVGDTLGKGGFGKVMKALHLEEQQYYAIKYIPESKTSSTSPSLNDAARARHMESFRKEIDILKRIQHPHIVQFKEVIRYRGQGLGLVMELMPGGDLHQYLHERGKLSEQNTKYLAHQICSALAYLHKNHIVHRDLKPQNILLSECQPPVAKLADFGLAKIINSNALLSKVCGTELYMAPEVQRGHINQTRYDKVIDSWSLGVTLAIMVFSMHPFKDQTKSELNMSLLRSDSLISPPGQEVLIGLLKRDPQDRMTPSAVLDHGWLSEVRWEASTDGSSTTSNNSVEMRTEPTLQQASPHSGTVIGNRQSMGIPLVNIQNSARTVIREDARSDFLRAAMQIPTAEFSPNLRGHPGEGEGI